MRVKNFIIKHQLLIFFFLVFIFRSFYASNMVSFSQDQARDVWKMEQFKSQGKIFIEYGPKASVGNFYLAPFYYQLSYFASLLTNNHPLTMHWIITFVESLTPIILFLILNMFIRKRYAYLSSFLYALSPLVTSFATFSWNPNMIPFLSLLSLLLAIKHLTTGKKIYVILFSISLSIAVHLHYQSIVLFPFYIFIFIKSILKDKQNFKSWILGLLLALLLLFPYFTAEINNNWTNTKAIINYFTGEHSRYFDRVSKIDYFTAFIPNLFDRIFFGKNITFMNISLGQVVFFFGFIFLIFKSIADKKIKLILAYFLAILVMLRVYKGDKLDYYMSSLFVFPYFLIGFMMEKFKLLFIPIIMIILVSTVSYYSKIELNNGLRNLEKAVTFISENVEEKNINFHLHNDDHVNVFSYGVNQYSNLNQDKNSLIIVDVCGNDEICDWDGSFACKYDRAYTFMILFREKAEYELIKSNLNPLGYRVRIGKVKEIPTIEYSLLNYSNEYGNDFLESGW